MDFIFDPVQLFGNLPDASNPFAAMAFIFIKGGWLPLLFVLLWGAWEGWIEYIRNKFDANTENILLAIDIPQNNEQNPKAVEQIFAHLYGIKKHGNLYEQYVEGFTQMNLSMEIVSVEGYIQFLIRTPIQFRDLVEAAVYAQYPDAEITEVEDYVDLIPRPLELADSEYNLYGTELKLEKDDLYPLKTYPLFEHPLSQKFMDPLGSLLELMSRMSPREHLWLQILVAPVGNDWHERGMRLINKLIGKKSESGGGADWLYFPREVAKGFTESFTAAIVPPTEMGGAQKNQKKEREWPSMMQHLSPHEREIVEAVGMKITKIGFYTKMRFIYAAPKDIFQKSKGKSGMLGALQQFGTLSLNGFRENKKTRTKINYWFKKSRVRARQRRILWGYRYRSMKRGRKGFILNIEELATLWHFPTIEVKVATVQTVAAKKGQPPSTLPLERIGITRRPPPPPAEPTASPPANLPVA